MNIYPTTIIKSMMPRDKVPFYNSIDMVIFLYFLEVTFIHNNISFQRYLTKEEEKGDLIRVVFFICHLRSIKNKRISLWRRI